MTGLLGEGIRPGKLRETIDRGTIHIDEACFWGIELRPGKLRDPVNWGTVNRGFTIVQSLKHIYLKIATQICHMSQMLLLDPKLE